MRKILLFGLVLMSTFSYAQTLNIHFKNGTTIEYNKELVDHVDFSEKPAPPTLTAGESVDLGLSVKWASCNLGAAKPEEYGDYYAWGETQEKTSYDKENYAYYNASNAVYTSIGTHINRTQYDAAHVNLGGGWRMPTDEEFRELETKCSWKWVDNNGVLGHVVTGKNGSSIFLPASGFKTEKYFYFSKEAGFYWCDCSDEVGFAHYFKSSSSSCKVYEFGKKYDGYSIRPVISYDDADGTDYDDTPVTSKISSYYAGGSIMSNGSTILSGSKLNFYFQNGSPESVTLTGIQLVNGKTNAVGSNLLSSDVTVAAGESLGYTISVGVAGIEEPICRFTYRYNKHTYTTEAKYKSYNFAKGKTTQLIAQ